MAGDASSAPVTYAGQADYGLGAPRTLYGTAHTTPCALDPRTPLNVTKSRRVQGTSKPRHSFLQSVLRIGHPLEGPGC